MNYVGLIASVLKPIQHRESLRSIKTLACADGNPFTPKIETVDTTRLSQVTPQLGVLKKIGYLLL